MLLLLGIGFAFYMVYKSGFNQEQIVVTLFFVISYGVSIVLIQFPASVKKHFGKKT